MYSCASLYRFFSAFFLPSGGFGIVFTAESRENLRGIRVTWVFGCARVCVGGGEEIER